MKNCIFKICIAITAIIPVIFPDYAVTQSKNDIKQHSSLCWSCYCVAPLYECERAAGAVDGGKIVLVELLLFVSSTNYSCFFFLFENDKAHFPLATPHHRSFKKIENAKKTRNCDLKASACFVSTHPRH